MPHPLYYGHRDCWRFHYKLCPRWICAANDNGSLDHVRGQLHDGSFAGVISQSGGCDVGAPGKTAGKTTATAGSDTSGAAVELESTRQSADPETALCPLHRHATRPAPASPETFGVRAGPLDAIVLAEIGAPSAIARHELCAGLRPPCAEGAGIREIVDEDVSSRGRLLRRKAIARFRRLFAQTKCRLRPRPSQGEHQGGVNASADRVGDSAAPNEALVDAAFQNEDIQQSRDCHSSTLPTHG
jgi:hypothetical protein